MRDARAERDETVVAYPGWLWGLLWAGIPLAGAGLGVLVKLAAGWAAARPRLPLPGWFRLIADIPEPWATIGAATLGLVAGVLLTLRIHGDSLTVAVSDHRVRLTRDGSTTELARTQMRAVFLDGEQLVLLGHDSAELAREACDLERRELERAFVGHGYPWSFEGDPYRDAFRRWVPGLPDLPPGADALFQARQKALDKNDDNDAADLRAALAGLGIVVRDEKPRQYWRALAEASPRAEDEHG